MVFQRTLTRPTATPHATSLDCFFSEIGRVKDELHARDQKLRPGSIEIITNNIWEGWADLKARCRPKGWQRHAR
jgi:hypothetical protein